jgi:hypothetical protein
MTVEIPPTGDELWGMWPGCENLFTAGNNEHGIASTKKELSAL